ncbi:immunity 22 family protein [Paenibacillus ehimensis]|uniref:immunity 22 family protein n=1 Tax=Paenibacillus ehimensis TaxID=79264 RepID=UPI0004709F6E|nr:immunity 22 family protein [Paenibacillus ehimensis]
MKHVVAIWGANCRSEEELAAFVESGYTEDGDAIPSEFVSSTGLSWIDEDFMEIHWLPDEESCEAFVQYLKLDYASDPDQFAPQVPDSLRESMAPYPSVIMLYGNDSRYGSVNEALFSLAESGSGAGQPSVPLIAKIVYETEER